MWSSARVLFVYMGHYIEDSLALNHSVYQSMQFIEVIHTFPILTHGTVLSGSKNIFMLHCTLNAMNPCYVFLLHVRAATCASEYVQSMCMVNEEH